MERTPSDYSYEADEMDEYAQQGGIGSIDDGDISESEDEEFSSPEENFDENEFDGGEYDFDFDESNDVTRPSQNEIQPMSEEFEYDEQEDYDQQENQQNFGQRPSQRNNRNDRRANANQRPSKMASDVADKFGKWKRKNPKIWTVSDLRRFVKHIDKSKNPAILKIKKVKQVYAGIKVAKSTLALYEYLPIEFVLNFILKINKQSIAALNAMEKVVMIAEKVPG